MNLNRRAAWIAAAAWSLAVVAHAQPRPTTVTSPESAAPPPGQVLSAMLQLGLAFGGDEIPNRSIDAGQGMVFGFGAASAPFWLSWLGFGAGADFGVKYTQGGSGGYSLERWPLALHADVLARLAPRSFVRVAGGPYLELGVEITRDGGNGGTDRKLPHAFGYLFEGGLRQRLTTAFALDVTLRLTHLHYENSARSSAGGVGGFFGLHYVLW